MPLYSSFTFSNNAADHHVCLTNFNIPVNPVEAITEMTTPLDMSSQAHYKAITFTTVSLLQLQLKLDNSSKVSNYQEHWDRRNVKMTSLSATIKSGTYQNCFDIKQGRTWC